MKTSIYIGTSIDGYIAREDGSIDWLENYNNNEIFKNYSEFIKKIDAVIIGKGTFEKVLTFPSWPYDKMVFVLSSSIKKLSNNIKGKAEVISMKPKEVLNILNSRNFTTVNIDGGKVIQSFLRDDCIDEMIISKVPVLLGKGIPMFSQLDSELLFNHIGTNVYSNGLVMSRYERKRE